MNAAPYPSPQARALSHVESRSAGRRLDMVWHCLARFGAPPHPTRPIRAQNVGSDGVRAS
ncbi:hypothetical protein OG609_14935 [Streptomyces sp. NBC_01224]|uniref:hypothetical protein n=1 Tax=Streptomyces sp. NBC_01224 TaxID=2903783 RepID=UPI002E0FCD46|nr:hypothetical protein OG609_14935 [Streptomyces sp. NBC_01224]